MVKKKSVKKTSKKKTSRKSSKSANTQLEKVLIENFVSLQKVLTNMSVKFDNLSTQISKLLELFEISAKALAEKDESEKEKDRDTKEIKDQIKNISEQNKVIARGVSLLHEKEDESETQNIPQNNPQYNPSISQQDRFKQLPRG
ncbi:hypothetical protein K9L16_00075 [Candidatus Pacearchaeota archaeon]|nr:hypothetical protein [Candidatus Pacearchaeota archaeon]